MSADWLDGVKVVDNSRGWLDDVQVVSSSSGAVTAPSGGQAVVWLGDIALQLPAWPTAMDRKQGHNYAEHQPVNGPPLLQSTGRNLVEYTLSGRLHRQFGSAPSTQLSALRGMVDRAEAVALVFGSGEYPGKFVLTELSETPEQTGPGGDPDSVSVSITLREYVENDRTAPAFRAQLDQAKGLIKQAFDGVKKLLR